LSKSSRKNRKELRDSFKDSKQKSLEDLLILGSSPLHLFSTGVYAVDRALHGGLPFGKFIGWYGKQSTGKCLTSDSWILTANDGWKTLEEVFKLNGLEPTIGHKVVEKTYRLVNCLGEPEDTTHFTFNGKKKVRKISTRSGFQSKTTLNHPLLVVSCEGNLVWKQTKDIKEGDFLVSLRQNSNFGTKSLKFEDSYMLGLLIADGYFGPNKVTITNNCPYIKKFIEINGESFFGVRYLEYSSNDRGSVEYHFNSKELVSNFYSKYNLSEGVAKDKKVPSCIMEGDKQTIIDFLCGYLESESHISGDDLTVSSASYKLLIQVKLLLQQLGVKSTISTLVAKEYPDNEYWNLCISGSDYTYFIEEYFCPNSLSDKGLKEGKDSSFKLYDFPFLSQTVRDLYLTSENKSRYLSNLFGGFRNGHNIGFDLISQILEAVPKNHLNKHLFDKIELLLNYTFDEVTNVEDLGYIPTFDFSMKNTSSFIANGVVNHNTSSALRALGQVNLINWETGKYDFTMENPCGTMVIDLENSFEAPWARNVGYDEDLDENDVIQVVGGENVGDMVLDAINSDIYSAILIDSFESMMPLKLTEENMETNEQGRRAQLLAKCFRKWIPALVKAHKRNKDTPWRVPAIIYLNHAIEKMMVLHLEWTIPGGNSQRFYASIEMIMSKIAYNNESKKEFGLGTIKGVVEKNKCTGPRGTIFTYDMALKDLEDMSVGQVDNAKTMLKDLKDYDLVTKTADGYEIFGEVYRVQSDFKDKIYADSTFEKEVWQKLLKELNK